MTTRDRTLLERVRSRLVELRSGALELEGKHAAAIAATQPAFRAGARNLVHYLSLRQHDLRALQADLADLGLSSLGRSEPQVLPSLDAVIGGLGSLHALTAVPRRPEPTQASRKNVYQTLMARNVRGVQAEPYCARLVVQGTQQGQ